MDMYSRVNPEEVVVGWYSTGREISYISSLIHLSFADLSEVDPFHLLVDTNLTNNSLSVSGYTAGSLEVEKKRLFTRFDTVPVTLVPLTKGEPSLESLAKNVELKLDAVIQQLSSGKISNTQKTEVGMALHEALRVNHVIPEDDGMVVTLASSTKEAIRLADKIHSGMKKE